MQSRNDSITMKGSDPLLLYSFDSVPSGLSAMATFASIRSHYLATLVVLAGSMTVACQAAAAPLVSESAASQAGLTRAWFGQVALDVSRHQVAGVELASGRLFVLSDAGQLQAFDAETGQSLWTERLGNVSQISYGPAAKGDLVAMINGTTLYLLDSATGNEKGRYKFRSAPSAAPAISDDYVFVPLVNGRLEGIPRNSESKIRWNYASSGRAVAPPTVVGDRVLWATQRDYLYGALLKGGAVYRFQAAGHLLAPAASIENTAFLATNEGFLYAIDADKGQQLWRASVGVSVDRPAVALPGSVYVGSEAPALHAFDPALGAPRWTAPGISDFVAASAQHVYGVSPDGRLSVLDAETGRVVAHLPGVSGLVPVTNSETDRLYFLSSSGLVQCLHETSAKEPRSHMAQVADEQDEVANSEPESETPFETSEEPFAEEEPADEPAEEEPANEPFGADPFGDASEEEAEDEDDPFGF